MSHGTPETSIEHILESNSHLNTVTVHQFLLTKLVAMPRWFVLDLGARDRILPMVLEENSNSNVCLFTSAEMATRTLQASTSMPESARVISMMVHEAPEFLSGLRSWGVQAAVFNPGPYPFECKLDDLIISSWKNKSESIPDIDDVVAKARKIHPKASSKELWSTIMELPQWYFIADPTTPMDPMVGICRDQPCALAFTDPVRARRYASMMDPSGEEAGNCLIALSPSQASWWFRTLAARGIAGAIFNDGPFAFFSPIGQMTAPVDAVRSVA